MKRSYNIYLLFAVSILGCSNNPGKNLEWLNGYWEIDHVKLENGSDKTYNYSEQYDYFEVKSDSGTRRKVTPLIDGKYLTTEVSENVKILHTDGKIYLEYSTYYNKWKEELLKLDQDELQVKNSAGNIFYYKRPKPFKIE